MKVLMKKTFIITFLIVCLGAFAGCGTKGSSDPGKTEVQPLPPVITIEDDTDKIKSDTDEIKPGETIDATPEPAEEEAAQVSYDPSDHFYAEEISDDLFSRMQGKSYPKDCPINRDDLRHLILLYKDINGETHEGEMVCNAQIADRLIDIFRQLYEADYPIEKMVLIDEYGGDDDASMEDNNTSCFNYRVVSGTKKISRHGYGMAVDLNPRYNPYVHTVDGQIVIEPVNGQEYADREADFDYKIDKDDLAYKLFTQAGFTWGGSWKNMKDYQHFQIDAK